MKAFRYLILGGGFLLSSLAATSRATAADPTTYTTDGPKIVMTTEAISSFVPWSIMIKADAADAESIWIDLNNNQKFDEGEEAKVNTDRADEYPKMGGTVTIYGAVRELVVNFQALSSLNVSGNENLQVLNCYKNKLTSLDLSKNKELTQLVCRNNQLGRLDLSANNKLQTLDCAINNIAELKLNFSAPLQKVNLSSNQFIGWSAAGYTQLDEVACFGNFIAPGKMMALIESLPSRTAENPGRLYMVDTEEFPNGRYSADIVKEATKKNWKVFDNKGGKKGVAYEGSSLKIAAGEDEYIILTTSKTTGQGSDTWGVKAVLANNEDAGKAWIDFNGNGVKDTNEIIKENGMPIYLKKSVPTIVAYGKFSAFDCGSLQTADNSISSIDISHAPSLAVLTAYSNELTELDVTNNPNLAQVSCAKNKIAKVNFSQSAKMQVVELSENNLTSLDLSACEELKAVFAMNNEISSLTLPETSQMEMLIVSNNNLTSIDLRANRNLSQFVCEGNRIESLNLADLRKLYLLSCGSNKLKTLDLRNNTALKVLRYENNDDLEPVDLSNLVNLYQLYCGTKKLTELDVTHMPAIYELDCSEASLTKLLIPKENILHLVSCYSNKLDEQTIRGLVDRLCDRYKVNTEEFEAGSLYAINTSNSEEGNFVSVYAADVARSKGWDTYDWQDGENKGKNPYAGKPGAVELLQTEAAALYPTVASEAITLSISNKEGARVQIYALDGTLVLSTVATSSKTTIDVSSLSEGVYFLHVANRIERFVVAR
nr:T9SS type A sorting domain-containing protein [uncultured Porphyromonas sp.]